MQLCCKCNKASASVICTGCKIYFCNNHFNEHRQELAIKMDILNQEHDFFRQDLLDERKLHSFLRKIDNWEKISVKKIQEVAEKARKNVRKILEQENKQFKMLLGEIAKDLRSNRESEDYTELDLDTWNDQLKKLRLKFEKPLEFELIKDHQTSSDTSLISLSEYLVTSSWNTAQMFNTPTCNSIQLLKGEWEYLGGENINEVLKKAGFDIVSRKQLIGIKNRMLISNKDSIWTWTFISDLKQASKSFLPGLEFDETTLDGRKVTSIIRFVDSKWIHEMIDKNGNTFTITRFMDDNDQQIVAMECGLVKGYQCYRRIA